MKKTLALVLVIGLVAAAYASPAAAAKKKKKKKKPAKIERVVEFEYECPCGVRVLGQGLGWQFGSATGENIGGGPVAFDPATEKYLAAEAKDGSGQTVYVLLAMDTDPNNTSPNDPAGSFCGKTDKPLEMPDAEAEFRVFVHSGTCEDGTPTFATGGTITFTFSNIP
jgi:hypothetical protein